MNLLTIRRLPVLSFANSKNNYRTRISEPLLGFIQKTVQAEFPGLKCGKRFSLEYALQQFLANRGALKKYAAELPSTVEMIAREINESVSTED